MMSSDIEKCAKEIIEKITAKLDQSLIKSRFDEPIAKIAGEFKCEVNSPIGHKAFHNIIADFVEQIYGKALKAGWMLTDPLAEAILLLESYYQSSVYGNGYAAALLDATSEAEGGFQTVLNGLAEIIKDIEKHKYVTAVFTLHLHSCSWDLQCEIVRILLEKYEALITPQLCKCVPAQLIDEIPAIMYRYICSDFMLQQISFCTEKPLTVETLVDRELL